MLVALVLKNVYLDMVFSSLVTRSVLECSAKCYSSSECRSFLFDQQTHQCHLCDAIFTDDPTQVTPTEGINYYRFVSSTPAPPGYIYERILERYYKVHPETLKWAQARDACQAEGGVLAMPKTASERDFYMRIMDSELSKLDTFFGGENSSGTWKWLDGTNATGFTIHGSEKPNRCLELETESKRAFDVARCNGAVQPFVCEHL